jgi:hypothetical protein
MLETEMSRRRFLTNVGVAAVALVGIPAILKAFGLQETSGAGSTPSYGGREDAQAFRSLK